MAKTDFNFDSVSLTEDVLNAAKAKTILNEGWHAGLVVDAESQVSEKKGSPHVGHDPWHRSRIRPTLIRARAPRGDTGWCTRSPIRRSAITLPRILREWRSRLCKLSSERKRMTAGSRDTRARTRRRGEFEYQGSVIDAEDVASVKSQLTEKGLQKALQVLKDPALLVSDERAVYFKVEHDEYEGIKQHRITRLAVNLPEGASLVAPTTSRSRLLPPDRLQSCLQMLLPRA